MDHVLDTTADRMLADAKGEYVHPSEPVRIDSLAALKRAIVPGARIKVLAHWQARLVGSWRTPIRIQDNAYIYAGTDTDGKPRESWCYTPKASELGFNSDGSVTYFPGGERSWTLLVFPPID